MDVAQERRQAGGDPNRFPPSVRLTFYIPRSWHAALKDAAATQGLSMAQLCRLVLGGFLRNRLQPQEPQA